jgi:peptidoglycan/xylan/chitin deacetylase (PgdA/CDA1 family)
MKTLITVAIVLLSLIAAQTASAISKPLANPKGYVALTYDDGPSEYTPTLLNTLTRNQVRATFFVIGEHAQQRQGTIMDIHHAGHEIGWHSWSHPWLNRLVPPLGNEFNRQVDDALNLLRGWGIPVHMARPPYGELDQGFPYVSKGPQYQAIEARGMFIALWQFASDAKDWTLNDDPQAAQKICARVTYNARDGAVILMHDSLPQTVAAAQCVIDSLRKKGLEPGRVVETDQYSNLNNSWAMAVGTQSHPSP